MDMTHRICDLVEPLLRPDTLVPVREVLEDRSLIPDVGGVYGWWFDRELPGVPLEATLTSDRYRLLYVGIAPKAPDASGKISRSTLRRRICRDHLGKRLARSTLRRSLAAHLDMAVFLNPAGKRAMSVEHEQELTKWLAEHAALSFMIDPAPWMIEDELLQQNEIIFPFNIAGATHSYRSELLARRAVKIAAPQDIGSTPALR